MSPYYFTDLQSVADCRPSRPWGVLKESGETIGCHRTRSDAINQMVALSIAEDLEPGGEWLASE
jgi:hypothetical protein